MKIVVLAGGLSTERDVSLTTGTMVCNALREKGHQAILVDLFFGVETLPENINDAFITEGMLPPRPVKNEAPDIPAIRASRADSGYGDIGKNVLELCKAADIVFMALHGEIGENGKLQAVFDIMNIKYTGSGYMGSAMAMDKGVSKQIFLYNNIPTPQGRIFKKGDVIEFPVPCIVKPCGGGSSIGVKKVFNEADFQAALDEAFRYEDEILIEQFVTGREFTCGVLGGVALPPAEIIPKGDFYDYQHKYQDGFITEVCPAQISPELTKKMQDLAVKVYQCLKLDIYSRMDFLMDEKENFYCLEANTLPGMTPTSHMPQEAKAAGISYGDLCEKIIELSLKRFA